MATVIVGGVVALAVGLAARSLYLDRKKKGGCGCGCESCPCAGNCGKG